MLFIKQKYLPYAIAFFSVGVTLLVKLGLEDVTGITSSFSLWLIAISINTWYGSITSGLTSVFLAALANHYFFTIQIQLHLDAAVSNVLGDAIRLQQVVWNLLSNAIKFSSKNESVEVRLEQVESQAQITVIDTGRGIEAEFIPFVFERFSQRDASTTRSAGGLGLGLAIALTIVELHNGNITAASAGFGKGSTFTVRLPIVKMTKQLSNEELVVGELLHGNQKIAQLQNLCILVVDDDADARMLMQTVLQSAGADVLVAASVKEALALLEQQSPTLLISDISMPDEDGFTLIRQVRSRTIEQGGQIPAIALTAFAEAKNEQRILKAGFQLFITKPIEPMELVDKIIEVLKT
ncbi:MAG: response regulator [Nostoc sp. NMS7]|uniref:ATP-binding protein n=1 Tax=Nostoc sp. NMS7 TaxID=2815391 RepID=UPI0025E85640|nr:ATP-binding protein [Nostoc sp. NMS7]MBN3946111.1 response regulator [Nostoc sp. NMS7]